MVRVTSAIALIAVSLTRSYAQIDQNQYAGTVTVWQSCNVPTTTIYPPGFSSFPPFSSFSSSPIASTSTCSISTLSGYPTATPTGIYQSGAPSCPSFDALNACNGTASGTSCTDANGVQYQIGCASGPTCGIVIPTSGLLMKRGFAPSFGSCVSACDNVVACVAALYRPGAAGPNDVCTLFAEAYNFVPMDGAQYAVRPAVAGLPSSAIQTTLSSFSGPSSTNTASSDTSTANPYSDTTAANPYSDTSTANPYSSTTAASPYSGTSTANPYSDTSTANPYSDTSTATSSFDTSTDTSSSDASATDTYSDISATTSSVVSSAASATSTVASSPATSVSPTALSLSLSLTSLNATATTSSSITTVSSASSSSSSVSTSYLTTITYLPPIFSFNPPGATTTSSSALPTVTFYPSFSYDPSPSPSTTQASSGAVSSSVSQSGMPTSQISASVSGGPASSYPSAGITARNALPPRKKRAHMNGIKAKKDKRKKF